MHNWSEARRLAARLAHMPVAEVLGRSQQLVRRTAGRWGLRRERGQMIAVPGSRRVIVPALLDIRETARAARATDPLACDALLGRAEDIRAGRFEILGFGLLSFGAPVDWHWDAVHGRRTPRIHHSRIDPLDADAVGDHKIIWELNRHGWLVTLAQAYVLTDDSRYAHRASELLAQWLSANPPGVGINWVSSLEVAMRLVTWLYAWPILRTAAGFDEELCRRWLASADAHARHLRAFPSYYFSPNTHLTAEALALRLCGLALPELGDASRYRRLGERVLERELERQLHPDGFHYEQSACYHRYTLEFLIVDLLAGALNAWTTDGGSLRRLASAIDAMLPLVRPDGLLANVGDEDGGQLLRLGVRDPLDARPILGAAAVILGRADLKAIVGTLAAEVVWLLGPRARELYDALPLTKPAPVACALPTCGYVAVRNAWTATGDHFLLDTGPHGSQRCRFGHAHDDALALTIVAAGRPLVIDPGSGSYSDSSIREMLRSTFAHSTVWIDGQPRSRAGRTFEWLTAARGQLDCWIATDAGALVEASQTITCPGMPVVGHRRRVVYRQGHGWLIWDRFEGTGERALSLQWVLAGGGDEWQRSAPGLEGPAGSLGVLAPTQSPDALARAVVPIPASPRYGLVEQAIAFRCTFRSRLPADVVTLVRGPGLPAPKLERLAVGEAELARAEHACCLRDAATREVIILRGLRDALPVPGDHILADAAAAWLSADGTDGLILDGRRLDIGARRMDAPAGVRHWSISAAGAMPLQVIEEWRRS